MHVYIYGRKYKGNFEQKISVAEKWSVSFKISTM